MPALRNSLGHFEYFGATSWDQFSNIDGVVSCQLRGERNRAYTQVYRNGCVESVIIYERNDNPIVYAPWQERMTLKYVDQYTRALFALDVHQPIFVFLSLFNARGYRLHLGERMFRDNSDLLDRDALLLPEVSIEEPDFKAGLILKPLFDSMWHAFNFPEGTRNVNDAGDWIGPRM